MAITTHTSAPTADLFPPAGPGDRAGLDELGEFELPPAPEFRRCGLVRGVDHGPWVGTLVSCVRQAAHGGDHVAELGDRGAADHWHETWA